MSARIAFVAYAAYPLLDSSCRGGIGGAEVRAVTFARGLQQLTDYSLEFIVKASMQRIEESAGIRVRTYRTSRGAVRALEKWRYAISKRWSRLPRRDPFYHALSADVVLCFGVRNDTASIVRSARESGKQTAVFLTSDRNVEDALRQGRRDRGIYGEQGRLCRFAIEQADRVVAQTEFQQRRLAETLGVSSTLIPNPIVLQPRREVSAPVTGPEVLWVGRADTFSKRADLCMELAQRCPRLGFLMIMNNHHDATFAQLRRQAPPNVKVVEQVPYADVEDYFRRATVLINTSAAEGFPNSFLQAGKYGKPIVSLAVDPSNMLTRHGCGIFCNGDMNRMAAEVRRLIDAKHEYHKMSRTIFDYVRRYHDAGTCCRQLQQLLAELRTIHLKTVA